MTLLEFLLAGADPISHLAHKLWADPLMQSSMAGRVHLMAMSDGLDFNIFTYYIKVEGSSD